VIAPKERQRNTRVSGQKQMNDMLGGLSPDEVWSSTRSDHSELPRAHVFGCLVYVLDPALADGHSIPKWDY
jgi:hypothetical protein